MNRWAILVRPFGTLMLRIHDHPCPSVAHFSTPPSVVVPQGHPKIAQRFIAGLTCPQIPQAPEGRKKTSEDETALCRPLRDSFCCSIILPTDKSVRYFQSSHRDFA